ncbi:hypothetical protein ACHAWF_008582 [Thalassiosira exigua]
MGNYNWRETLFVWDGILSLIKEEEKENEGGSDAAADGKGDSSSVHVKWEGTWVGCDCADATKVATPRRGAFDEFVSSEHKFEVRGTGAKGGDGDDREKEGGATGGAGDGALSPYRVDMTGGSGYDLGEGDDKKRHKDARHDVYFLTPTLRWTGNLKEQAGNMVFAVGENEFGNFVSVGWLRVGNRVTLARRYVDEGDVRAKWDVDDLRKAVFDQIATEGENGQRKMKIPPWQCAAMHVDARRIAKRQKVAEE